MTEVAIVSLEGASEFFDMEIPMIAFRILFASLCTFGCRISLLCIKVTVVSIHPGAMCAMVEIVSKAAEMPKT